MALDEYNKYENIAQVIYQKVVKKASNGDKNEIVIIVRQISISQADHFHCFLVVCDSIEVENCSLGIVELWVVQNGGQVIHSIGFAVVSEVRKLGLGKLFQ